MYRETFTFIDAAMNSISTFASDAADSDTAKPPLDFHGNDTVRLRHVVDQLLASRLRGLKLPPEILTIFNARTSRRTRGMMASWCMWIASMDFVLAMFDFFILTGAALWVVLGTRVVIIAGFMTSSFLLKRKSLIGREHFAIIIPCVAALICVGVAAYSTQNPILSFDYLVTAALMAVTAILFLNIDVKNAKILTVFAMVGLSVLTLMIRPTGLGIRLQLACLFNGTIIALYEARKVMILYQQRLFLVNLRNEITSAETANVNAQLSSIAYIDQLTDIPNRRYFDEICASMSESTKNLLPLSICMIDIDYFKCLNDTLGHLQGDHCLRVIANTIRHNLRGKTDILVRFGGEEFLLLLPGTDIDRASDIAERVRAAIAGLQHPNPGSPLGVVTASIGITMIDAHPVDMEALMERADAALYRAKNHGRNRVGV